MERRQATDGRVKKRKAESQDTNERLSKRLELLNLERNGQKLFLPAGTPSKPSFVRRPTPTRTDGELMQVDNTSHKVYIHNLEDELSDSDSSSDESKVVFHPDLDKRLRSSRIPPSILANKDGELAGRNLNNELILYGVPSSLSYPEDKDSVRKAMIETRARAQEKQRREREVARTSVTTLLNGRTEKRPPADILEAGSFLRPNGFTNEDKAQDDPDAMDID